MGDLVLKEVSFIMTMFLGGGFGGKERSYILSSIAAVAAHK